MKVIEIKNLSRKDVPIYYRRLYSGVVVLELLSKTIDIPLDFYIEHKPTGLTEISITSSVAQVDYPLIPLKKELKKFIGALDSDGKLPN
ncbi:MAG: hypothetical protein FWC64_00325 [Treponema sp.]|nr:hypothetical protein [Treponema sp.]